jgi:TrmH family RNA methyltransferase
MTAELDGTNSMSEERITSPQNARIKLAARLRQRRHRDRQDRFLIDGVVEISRALDAGIDIAEVFVSPTQCVTPAAKALVARLGDSPLAATEVAPSVLWRLAYGERCDGLVAVARAAALPLADIKLPDDALVAVVETVEKPGNLGAILRSADAAGVSAVVAADKATDPFNPNTIRASLGTVFTMSVAVASSEETLEWLRANRFTMFATRVDGERLYHEADFRGRTAIVLGSEATGLTDRWTGGDVASIRLPMLGAADSLNVSATAAILFYEALRQRGRQ